MAVFGTAQEDLTPRGDVYDLQWTSPVPHHHQDETSPACAVPTVNSLAPSPPARSTEAVPFYPTPSGTGTHSPLVR